MKKVVSLPILLSAMALIHGVPLQAKATKPIVVAVIDTGISANDVTRKFMCKGGHVDFTGFGLDDTNGHGTHISGLIDKHADGANYCQLILKFWDKRATDASLTNMLNALKLAIKLKVDVINVSAGGEEFSQAESALIKKALDSGIKVVVAAGNYGCELGKKLSYFSDQLCLYYPAMYDSRLTVVGNIDNAGNISKTSNRGSYVNAWEVGVEVVSLCRSGERTCKLSGTSQATAVRTGKIVNKLFTAVKK